MLLHPTTDENTSCSLQHPAIAPALQQARQKELQLNTRTWQLRFGLVIGAVLILSFVAVFVYVNRRHKKKMFENRVEMNEQYAIYREEKSLLEKEKQALEILLQEKNDEFQSEQQHLYLKMEEKNESINKLNQRILGFEKAHAQVKANYEADGKMASSGVFNLFREYTVKAKNKPKEEDWQRLIKMVERTLPNFKPVVAVRAGIKGDEYRVCVLSRLGFRPRILTRSSWVSHSLSKKIFFAVTS